MMAHHGNEPEALRQMQSELLKRFHAQTQGTAQREWPDGRIAGNDDGAVALVVGSDPDKGLVFIDFGKPVAWTAMPPQQAIEIAQMLIKHARAVSPTPLRLVVN